MSKEPTAEQPHLAAYPIDIGLVTITKGDPQTDLWLEGTVNADPAYSFSAKVYDLGSRYGIGGGRISKLEVRCRGVSVFHYDRGWDIRPQTDEQKRILAIILDAFAEPPVQD